MEKESETMLRFGTIGTGWIANSYVDGALDSGLWQLTAVYSRTKEKGGFCPREIFLKENSR